MFCTNCGKKLEVNSEICNDCDREVYFPDKENGNINEEVVGANNGKKETENLEKIQKTNHSDTSGEPVNSLETDEYVDIDINENPSHKDYEHPRRDHDESEDSAKESSSTSIAQDINETKSNNTMLDQPLSTASFFFMQVICLLPVINLLLLLFWAFSKKVNQNRKSYARSRLIWFIGFFIVILFLYTTMLLLRYPMNTTIWFSDFKIFINSFPS